MGIAFTFYSTITALVRLQAKVKTLQYSIPSVGPGADPGRR